MVLAIEHARVESRSGTAVLRDLAADDIDMIVAYWHDGGADLAFLGIDTDRMGDRDRSRTRFGGMLRTGDPQQRHIAYAIALDGKTVGYTMLNQYDAENNYSHWHIIAKDKRAGGISSALYPHRIKMYFNTTNMQRLIHQTRTRNIGVNRMLDKYVPVAETAFVENPDGLAAAGEFHMRHVRRSDLPRLFARAAELARI